MVPIPDILLDAHLQNHWSVALTFLSTHGRKKIILFQSDRSQINAVPELPTSSFVYNPYLEKY